MNRFALLIFVVLGCDRETVPPTAAPEVAPTVASATSTASTSTPTPTASAAETVSAPPSASPPPKATAKTAPAPKPSQPEKPVLGKQAVESNYAAWLQSNGRYTVGQPASVTAVLTAKGEYKCNDNYPYKVKLAAPPEGVSYPDTTARAVSKGKERTTVTVPFSASTPGDKTISGTFFFSVCNESTCKIDKRPLSVTVTVHPR